MKGIKALVALMVASSLLAAAVPASAGAKAYKHYVACGPSQSRNFSEWVATEPKPSHVCRKGYKKAAFFKSFKTAVHYTICVRFPSGKTLCAHHQPPKTKKTPKPKKNQLYLNKITSTLPGKHRVTWFVKGKKVGTYFFRVKR